MFVDLPSSARGPRASSSVTLTVGFKYHQTHPCNAQRVPRPHPVMLGEGRKCGGSNRGWGNLCTDSLALVQPSFLAICWALGLFSESVNEGLQLFCHCFVFQGIPRAGYADWRQFLLCFEDSSHCLYMVFCSRGSLGAALGISAGVGG